MISEFVEGEGDTIVGEPGSWRPDRWPLWRLRPGMVLLALVVEATAAAVVGIGAGTMPSVLPELLWLALALTVLGVVHTELATGIERVRRRTNQSSYFDLSSVWTFAAALLLPPAFAAAVVVVVYGHLWWRVWAPAGVPLHRHVYTTATVLLAARAAHEVVHRAGGLPGGLAAPASVAAVALAVVVYVLVNTVLVAAAVALTDQGAGLREVLGRWDDNALEVATLCMGALAAVAFGSTPGLVALVLPPVLVLHRAVLVRQLQEEVSTDAKTGLLTVATWQARATRAVRRVHGAGGQAAVLIVDIDRFKAVNDTHGHLAGDAVLAAVAEQLRAGVREHDLVGRFGGEEFVVFLPDLPRGTAGRRELAAVAERLRRRVADLDVAIVTPAGPCRITGLSVSVGGATIPADGTTLEQVMAVADASLYAAKGAGRNAVRIAVPALLPAPRQPVDNVLAVPVLRRCEPDHPHRP